MKKTVILSILALGAMSASAQDMQTPKFFDNWSVGVNGGVTTPMKGQAFFGSMRGLAGINIEKQITPVLGMGVEGQFGVNTSSWKNRYHSSTAFDNSYVGAYATVDLFNLFGGYPCQLRPFTIQAVAGAGWIHYYQNGPGDYNDFGTKLGLNFNFNVSDHLTIGIKPAIIYDMTAGAAKQSSSSYNINKASFNLMAGLTYRFGGYKFACVVPYNQDEVNALNGQINDLRASMDASNAETQNWENKAKALAQQLQECQNRPVQKEVVKEVTNNLNSVRYIFYRIGSSKITVDQQPNVEMVAQYLKNHKDATVTIRGYASPDGSLEFNIKLAQARAESVKNELIKRYKIDPSRIDAQGEGIGNMFSEESWNRVSICILKTSK